MFYNVALIRFKPEATRQQIEQAFAKLRELPRMVPQLNTLTVAANAGVVDGGHDAIIMGAFANVEAYRIYQTHPDHAAVAQAFLVPILEEIARIQYED